MRNLFKKSLAIVVALALCLTALVGAVTVNAETKTGTITSDVTVGDAAVDVVFTITTDGLNEAIFSYAYDEALGAPTAIASVNDDLEVVTAETGNLFELRDTSDNGLTDVTVGEVKFTFNKPADGTYNVTLSVHSAGASGTDEILIDIAPCTATVEIKAACEHTNKTTSEEVTKAATCTEIGYKTVTVTCNDCSEVISVTENVEIPALGHKYNYVNNGDGTHTGTCANDAEHTVTAAHTFVDGTCTACGAVEQTGPVYNSSVKVRAKNAIFQSDYSLMFAIPTSTAEGWYLEVKQDQYEGNTKIEPRVEVLTIDDLYNTQNVNGVQCYTLLFRGISARSVASEIRVTLYAEVDGVMSYGDTESYNLVTYARNQITKGTADTATAKQQKFAKAMVAFLNYAAASQTRFNYNCTEENLANACLTEDEKNLAPLAGELTNTRVDNAETIENPTASILAYAPQYKDKMTLSVLVDAPIDNANLYLQINYTDYKGIEKTDKVAISEGTDTSYKGEIKKQINFTSIAFADVRTVITLKVVNGDGVAISNTNLYSFEAYAFGRATTSSDYAPSRALVNFGDYIRLYLQ